MDGKGVTLDMLKMVNNSWDILMGKSLENGGLRDNLIRRQAKKGFFAPSDVNETVSSDTKQGQPPSLGHSNTVGLVQAFRIDSERIIELHLKPSDNPFSGLSEHNLLNGSVLKGFGTIFSKNYL